MVIFECVGACVCTCASLLGWRQVSSAVDFRWLPRTSHQGGSDPHKVTRFFYQHRRSDTRLPSDDISDNSRARLLFTPLQPPPSHVYTLVFFLSPRKYGCACARVSEHILCIDVCTHNISNTFMARFFPPAPLPVPTLISVPWTVLFSTAVYPHTRLQSNFDGR